MEPLVDPAPEPAGNVASTAMSAEALFRTHADEVFRYIRRRVDANDAEDQIGRAHV